MITEQVKNPSIKNVKSISLDIEKLKKLIGKKEILAFKASQLPIISCDFETTGASSIKSTYPFLIHEANVIIKRKADNKIKVFVKTGGEFKAKTFVIPNFLIKR